MKKFGRRLFSPIMAFIGIQLAWVLLVGFWIYWFVDLHGEWTRLAHKYGPELLLGREDWFILAEGLVLLLAILIGVYVIFLYWRRQAALNREQKRFFSQVTHELKSPLASLQLHLETMHRHQLPPEKLNTFVAHMLEDTERLKAMIGNLLTASRIEQRDIALSLKPTDLSLLLEEYLTLQAPQLPADATLSRNIQPGLVVRLEQESFHTLLRNLLENAVLYADKPLQLRVALRREGGKAHLTVADNGRGIEARELRKVFLPFYRVRRSDETKPGSGLGLFIVRNIVKRHRGKIRLESPGLGGGTTFHILLPLQET